MVANPKTLIEKLPPEAGILPHVGQSIDCTNEQLWAWMLVVPKSIAHNASVTTMKLIRIPFYAVF